MQVIFSILPQAISKLFMKEHPPPRYLAYVEWFSNFNCAPHPHHMLHQAKRSYKNGDRLATIIPLNNIRRSIHLFPKFGKQKPATWTSNNVLDLCDTFFVNIFSDRHAFHTMT